MEPPVKKDGPSFGDLVNIAELSVRRVIDMAKKIKSFKALSQLDQISLLKGGSIELLILRSVITFDKEKQQWLDPLDNSDHATPKDGPSFFTGGSIQTSRDCL
jgi:nuclear receptor subfamily 1 group I